MASASTLPAPALAASRAALTAAFADQHSAESAKTEADGSTAETNGDSAETLEPGEIQEVDMQAQAEGIRTVFSDATNFNVKVIFVRSRHHPDKISDTQSVVAPSVFPLDPLV